MSTARALFGGGAQVSAISLASAAPSKMRFLAEASECRRVRAPSSPSSMRVRRVRPTVSMQVSRVAAIWLSFQPAPASDASCFGQDTRLEQLARAGFAVLDHDIVPLALLLAEPNDELA